MFFSNIHFNPMVIVIREDKIRVNGMKKIAFVLALCILASALIGCLDQTQSEYQRVLVTQVVDGDTITVEGGQQVRLIGIDAPERDEDCYAEAKEYLRSLILYKEVDLEKDISDKDQYGRSLRYVWLGNKLVNAELVRAGVAIAKHYEPDTKYQRIIADAEQEAIEDHVGCLWSLDGQPIPSLAPTQTSRLSQTATPLKTKWESSDEGVVSYLEAGNYIGQTKTVEGTIVKTFKYTKGKTIFLNFHDPYQGYFTAVIWSSDWDKFPFAPEEYYKGKEVRVTGEIIDYKGSPEIVVRDPSQIEVVYPKAKDVAAVARHQGDIIYVTYMGGPDQAMVTSLDTKINGKDVMTDFASAIIGAAISDSGYTGTNNNVVVIATFSDGTSQVILDTYC